jgi:hypothetical protein
VKAELIQSELFAEVPQRLRKSGTPAWRFTRTAANAVWRLYITDSGSGCILRAKVPVTGRTLFSHL